MYAIHDSCRETITDKKHERKITDGRGYSVNTLMQKVVSEEQEKKESERRWNERLAIVMHTEKCNSKQNAISSSANFENNRKQKPNVPSCTWCGHAPDKHSADHCPNKGKIYCYRCQSFGTHIGRNCPKFGDQNKRDQNEKSNRDVSERCKNEEKQMQRNMESKRKIRKVPIKQFSRLNRKRQTKGNALITYSSSEEDSDNVYVDANKLDAEEYAFLFIQAKEDGAASTVFGQYFNIFISKSNQINFI